MAQKVIVSIASWPPRIPYVEACVKSLLDQSRVPDGIELNLSRQEFPGGTGDLPEGLRAMLDAPDSRVSINWEEGNTYCFRKEIPCVKRHFGEDFVMLSCDDDCIYAHTYIEKMLEHLGDTGVYDAYCSEHGVVGNRMIYRGACFWPDFWEKLTPEVVAAGISDTWAAVYLLTRGWRCRWEVDPEIDALITENADSASKSPNSERIGGYTNERQQLAFELSLNALS